MIVKVAVEDLLCCSDDQIANGWVKLLQRYVGFGCSLFQNPKGSNDAYGHGVFAYVEVDQGTGCLTTVVFVCWNLKFAHGVRLNAYIGHGEA